MVPTKRKHGGEDRARVGKEKGREMADLAGVADTSKELAE